MKLLFAPVGVLAGLLAGLVAKKGFEALWALIDKEEAPQPEERDARYAKLIPALMLEGAIFRLAKGLADHAARASFARSTGRWPGEERAES